MSRTVEVLQGQPVNKSHRAVQKATKKLQALVRSYDKGTLKEQKTELQSKFLKILLSEDMKEVFRTYDCRFGPNPENALTRDLVSLYYEIAPPEPTSLSYMPDCLAILAENGMLSESNCLQALTSENYSPLVAVCLKEWGAPNQFNESLQKFLDLPEPHSTFIHNMTGNFFRTHHVYGNTKKICGDVSTEVFQDWFDKSLESMDSAEKQNLLIGHYPINNDE
ncbi:hypothetical protein EOPP23_13805 [Endozoicomonas sp. OPT23]|nr:hypothetical protein [Endozoicomonas sp. OPT23]